MTAKTGMSVFRSGWECVGGQGSIERTPLVVYCVIYIFAKAHANADSMRNLRLLQGLVS